jgi:hypothetical protein
MKVKREEGQEKRGKKKNLFFCKWHFLLSFIG